jgi:hypothetical protein
MSKKYEVSLMAGEITEEIKSIDGFCTKKFKADHITRGLDYSKLEAGQTVEADGRRIRISKVGKPCFKDCPVPKEQKPCILSRNVAFGEYED